MPDTWDVVSIMETLTLVDEGGMLRGGAGRAGVRVSGFVILFIKRDVYC